MNDGELRIVERELGRLTGVIEGIGREIKVLREDRQHFMQAIADHDKRDDARFAGTNRELELTNRTLALIEQRHVDEQSADAIDDERWHNWQITLLIALATLAGPLITAFITVKLMGVHQ